MSSSPSNTATSTIYICRHGETEYNKKRMMQGRGINEPLNKRGLEQAALLAERFRSEPVALVGTSTLIRAKQTALSVKKDHPQAAWLELEGLEEMGWGELEGQVMPDMTLLRGAWQNGDLDYAPTGGESLRDVQSRVLPAFAELLSRTGAGDVVVVVTHGRLLRILLSLLVHGNFEHMNEFTHSNCSVVTLKTAFTRAITAEDLQRLSWPELGERMRADYVWTVENVGDASHLPIHLRGLRY